MSRAPLHLLYVVEGDLGLRYRIRCLGPTTYCRSYKPCDCPESKPSPQWDDLTWFEFEGDEWAHDVEHHDIQGEWMVPDDKCFFELVPAEVADAAGEMFSNVGWEPQPGVYLVEPTFDPQDHTDNIFQLVWTGAARLQMRGDLFHGQLPAEGSIYVGRRVPRFSRSPWHNPFKAGQPIPTEWEQLIGLTGTVSGPEHAVTLFGMLAAAAPGYITDARGHLKGKVIVCWCAPGTPCHGDSLLVLANQEPTR